MATALAVPPTRPWAPVRPTTARRPPAGPVQPPRPQGLRPLPQPPGAPPLAGPGAVPPPEAAPLAAPARQRSSDAELAARRFATVCLEVLNGYRPMAHLRRLVDPRGFEMIACGIRRRAYDPGPARPAGPPMRPPRVQIRRIRVCEPALGVAEASVVYSRGGLAWSMAIRLELRHRRWLCTVAQTLG
jgi:hypothetical protein